MEKNWTNMSAVMRIVIEQEVAAAAAAAVSVGVSTVAEKSQQVASMLQKVSGDIATVSGPLL